MRCPMVDLNALLERVDVNTPLKQVDLNALLQAGRPQRAAQGG